MQLESRGNPPLPEQVSTHADAILVSAPARLHLGFIDPDGHLGRRFGSIGLAVSHPLTTLSIAKAERDDVTGVEKDRAAKLLQRFRDALRIRDCFKVEIDTAIPAHAGLGSGTQLALALGAGMQTLAGQPVVAKQLGAIVDRGARSAIGIAAFAEGGFIVDGGKQRDAEPPPVIANIPFPESWRILLAFDRSATGIHGEREHDAFTQLIPLPKTMPAQLSHLTAMRMLPALAEHDIGAFGNAVSELQQIIGNYFAPVQGGSAFSSHRVEKIVKRMGALGATGLGQSSWGPTGFSFVESADAAERLYTTLVEEAKASGIDLMVVSGRNTGGSISPAPRRPDQTK